MPLHSSHAANSLCCILLAKAIVAPPKVACSQSCFRALQLWSQAASSASQKQEQAHLSCHCCNLPLFLPFFDTTVLTPCDVCVSGISNLSFPSWESRAVHAAPEGTRRRSRSRRRLSILWEWCSTQELSLGLFIICHGRKAKSAWNLVVFPKSVSICSCSQAVAVSEGSVSNSSVLRMVGTAVLGPQQCWAVTVLGSSLDEPELLHMRMWQVLVTTWGFVLGPQRWQETVGSASFPTSGQ